MSSVKTKRAARAKPLAATDALAAGGGAPKKRSRRRDEDDDDDIPYTGPMGPMPWENDVTAKQVQELLDAIDAPPIDDHARYVLQRIFHRHNQFGQDGAGAVVMICRCVLESNGNEGALIAPVIEAVADCVRLHGDKGLALVEAFDSLPIIQIIEQMRGLEIFKEASIGRYLGYSLCNKLARLLSATVDAPDAINGPERRSVTRVQLGLDLLKLRDSNAASFEKLARERFRIDPWEEPYQRAMLVAARYGGRLDLVGRASIDVLYQLCRASAEIREIFERKILGGEKVTGKMVTSAKRRERAPNGFTASKTTAAGRGMIPNSIRGSCNA